MLNNEQFHSVPFVIDSHCHLDYLEDKKMDLDEVVARAHSAGVGKMVTISTELSKMDRIVRIAQNYDQVYGTVGVHPHEADKEPLQSAAPLLEWAKHPKIVGIGETGLDYYYDHSDRAQQQTNLRYHIEAAQQTGLPIIIHTRDADEDTMSMLETAYHEQAYSGVIHCFTSSHELAMRMLAIGFYISISGIVTFKNAQDLRDTVRDIPLSRLLVETDSPFLAPIPKRGKTNQPAYVVHTLEFLANELECKAVDLAKNTTDNFLRLFTKVPQ